MALKACSECGVPEIITGEHLWLDNGDIVHKRARSSRMVFIETEILDPLFLGIEQIIGVPIEHMVITAGRRAYAVYLKSFVPGEVFEKIKNKEMDYEPLDAVFRDVGRINGVGSYGRVGLRYQGDEGDYDTVSISEPHSIPLTIAAHVGAIETLTGVDLGYRYEEVSTGVYDITAYPSRHLGELKERFRFLPYEHRDGGLELERCPTCGGPRLLSGFQWHQDRGIILNKQTGRRMAIQGDALLDPVFYELEAELGDTIPRAVVEAQRRFTRSGFYTSDDLTGKEDFRRQLALRGLGNLKELNMKRKGMDMRLENAALPLMVVGLAQGFFEIGYSTDSTVEWELTSAGDLEIEVEPRA
jgi:hypothetical protein